MDEPRETPVTSGEKRDDDLPPPVPLPRWVPLVIVLLLLGMAGLAVWTGLKYRNEAFTKPVLNLPQRSAPREAPGAPGEPEPGASRVAHGEYGENVPAPNAADLKDNARVVISGTGHSLQQVVRLAARRGMMLQVDPPDAVVYVNDNAIGDARQFSQPDDVYEFADEGSYTVRLVREGFRDVEFTVIARADAKDEIAVIQAKLQPGNL